MINGCGIVVRNKEGKYLIGYRADTHTWGGAGGHVEPGEDPRDAAVRELYEETHINADPEDLTFIKKIQGYDHGKEFVSHIYYIETDAIPMAIDTHEMKDWHFIWAKELYRYEPNIFPPYLMGLYAFAEYLDNNSDVAIQDGGKGSGNHGHLGGVGGPGNPGGSRSTGNVTLRGKAIPKNNPETEISEIAHRMKARSDAKRAEAQSFVDSEAERIFGTKADSSGGLPPRDSDESAFYEYTHSPAINAVLFGGKVELNEENKISPYFSYENGNLSPDLITFDEQMSRMDRTISKANNPEMTVVRIVSNEYVLDAPRDINSKGYQSASTGNDKLLAEMFGIQGNFPNDRQGSPEFRAALANAGYSMVQIKIHEGVGNGVSLNGRGEYPEQMEFLIRRGAKLKFMTKSGVGPKDKGFIVYELE
jgi:8-oxo-dGTP pyrophosphatase MutT (NUDIX family)